MTMIQTCAEHQDVDPPYVVLLPNPTRRFQERVTRDEAWIAMRSQDQDTLPDPAA